MSRTAWVPDFAAMTDRLRWKLWGLASRPSRVCPSNARLIVLGIREGTEPLRRVRAAGPRGSRKLLVRQLGRPAEAGLEPEAGR